jgi:RNase P/RNase MRP subunit p29
VRKLKRKYLDFIRWNIEVLGHSDPNLLGLRGIVKMETQRSFLVDVNGRIKKILKLWGQFKLSKGKEEITLFGEELLSRPFERARWYK